MLYVYNCVRHEQTSWILNLFNHRTQFAGSDAKIITKGWRHTINVFEGPCGSERQVDEFLSLQTHPIHC